MHEVDNEVGHMIDVANAFNWTPFPSHMKAPQLARNAQHWASVQDDASQVFVLASGTGTNPKVVHSYELHLAGGAKRKHTQV